MPLPAAIALASSSLTVFKTCLIPAIFREERLPDNPMGFRLSFFLLKKSGNDVQKVLKSLTAVKPEADLRF